MAKPQAFTTPTKHGLTSSATDSAQGTHVTPSPLQAAGNTTQTSVTKKKSMRDLKGSIRASWFLGKKSASKSENDDPNASSGVEPENEDAGESQPEEPKTPGRRLLDRVDRVVNKLKPKKPTVEVAAASKGYICTLNGNTQHTKPVDQAEPSTSQSKTTIPFSPTPPTLKIFRPEVKLPQPQVVLTERDSGVSIGGATAKTIDDFKKAKSSTLTPGSIIMTHINDQDPFKSSTPVSKFTGGIGNQEFVQNLRSGPTPPGTSQGSEPIEPPSTLGATDSISTLPGTPQGPVTSRGSPPINWKLLSTPQCSVPIKLLSTPQGSVPIEPPNTPRRIKPQELTEAAKHNVLRALAVVPSLRMLPESSLDNTLATWSRFIGPKAVFDTADPEDSHKLTVIFPGGLKRVFTNIEEIYPDSLEELPTSAEDGELATFELHEPKSERDSEDKENPVNVREIMGLVNFVREPLDYHEWD